MIDVRAIVQEHIRQRPPVPVLAMDDISPEDECGRRLRRSGTEGVAFLRTVDAAEADTLRMGVVEDFNRVAVEHRDNGTGEVSEADREE